jgi:predicted  nucleic acid-binding Zn-ribbon protein
MKAELEELTIEMTKEEQIAALNKNLKNLNESAEKREKLILGRIESVQKDLKDFKKSTDTRFDSIDEKFASIDEKFASVDEKLVVMDKQLGVIGKNLIKVLSLVVKPKKKLLTDSKAKTGKRK